MKRILLFCISIVLPTITIFAQITGTRPTAVKPVIMQKSKDTVMKASAPVTKTGPATAAPIAPAPAATQPLTALDYKLTSVRIKVNTGRDNKENPSEVYTKFSLTEQYAATYCAFAQWNLQNEMPVNSTIEVGLSKFANANLDIVSTKMTMSRPAALRTGANDISLGDIQQYGAKLFIYYYPHLFTDAWRIENVIVVLEFKDSNGNPHPVHGSKSLSFSNAKVFLNGLDNRYLVCEVGKDMTAMVSYAKGN